MLGILQGFQAIIENFVIPLVLSVGGLLLLIVFLYLVVVILHVKQRRKLEKTRERWRDLFRNEPDEIFMNPSKNNRTLAPVYRDELVHELRRSNFSQKSLVAIYRSHGGYEKDISELSSKTWWKRAGALARLKAVLDSSRKPDLPSLIYDDNHEVRLVALDYVAATGELPDVDPIDLFKSFSPNLDTFLLIKLLSTKPQLDFINPLCNAKSTRLRRCGATLLGQAGKTEFLSAAKELVRDSDSVTREKTVEALGKIGGKRPLKLLNRTAKDDLAEVRKATARSLGRLTPDDSLDLLETLSGDDDFSVRLEAFQSLAKFGEAGRKRIGKNISEEPELAREALFESYQG